MKTYSSSLWAALLDKQQNITNQRFEFTLPPRVFLVTTSKGLKPSTPTYVKGRQDCSLASGRFDIFWDIRFPLNLLQSAQFVMTELTKRLQPVIENPELRILPSVICRPWWYTCPWKCSVIDFSTWCFPGINIRFFSPDVMFKIFAKFLYHQEMDQVSTLYCLLR